MKRILAVRLSYCANILVTCASLILLLFLTAGVSAQRILDDWTNLSAEEFERYRHIFAPYNIQTHRRDIVALRLGSLTIFRIEASDFCKGSLCVTIVGLNCDKAPCSTTAVLAKRAVRFDSMVIPGLFGGTNILQFPLASGNLTVLVSRDFVTVSLGLED